MIEYSVIAVYSGKWQGSRNLLLLNLFSSCSKILGTVIVFTWGSHNSSENQQFWLWVPALPLGKSVSEFVFLPLSMRLMIPTSQGCCEGPRRSTQKTPLLMWQAWSKCVLLKLHMYKESWLKESDILKWIWLKRSLELIRKGIIKGLERWLDKDLGWDIIHDWSIFSKGS